MSLWQLAGGLMTKMSYVPTPKPSRLHPVYEHLGTLELRLAQTAKDIRKAQRLRYKVFYEQGGAIADRTSALMRRDLCGFDSICDHLLVIDHAAKNRFGVIKPKVVGTYRLLRQDVAERHNGFYTESEFDVAPMLARHEGKHFLELGRSCVLPEYRSKRTLELLWRGVWAYVKHHNIDAMFGCASFDGTDPQAHALAFSFIAQNAAADESWSADANGSRGTSLASLATGKLDLRKALNALPPLVKGYARVGAKFGPHAVIDHQFGTVDVFVIMPIADIQDRYVAHFGGPATGSESHSA